MKKILGLDLGVTSIGWALVNEKENDEEKSSIVKLGVRVNPLTADEQGNFEKGKSITTNAERTLKRGMRRNLQRYKLRRENLLKILKANGLISDETLLTECGNRITFETYRLRAKAAVEKISLEEFARVLLMINKKRGYKSSRKVQSDEDGKIIDGMEVAKQLYDEKLTPGQFVLNLIKQGKRYVPDFYCSDLISEFDRIWNIQKQFYPEILTEELRHELESRTETQTGSICAKHFSIVGVKRTTKGLEQKKENYEWRVMALSKQVNLEVLAVVFQKINGQINNSSGYLGDICDRSKKLYFNRQTIGQYLMSELENDPHFSLKNKVFYRQDYLEEFETIWKVQSQFHKELTEELKQEIRDVVIFYQRALKSQKNLINFCEFESHQIEVVIDGKTKIKTIGLHVCPKSSPLFQEFKIWQVLNNIQVFGKGVAKQKTILNEKVCGQESVKRYLYQEEKELLFQELNIKEKLSKAEVLKLLYRNPKELDLNFKEIEGNRTQAALFKVYQTIIEMSGHGEYDFSKMSAEEIMDVVESVFGTLGFNTDILHFDAGLEGKAFEKQSAYQFWHLLYSFDGDNTKSGNERLIEKIIKLYGFNWEYAAIFARINFKSDYGSLSSKAMRKILPHLKEGVKYTEACKLAGYGHSKNSLTKDELDNKEMKDRLEPLPRNSLRNPVVEKILNQMVNVVNLIVDTYGKPDEIRIELARELKKSAKEREDMTNTINKTTAEHEEYKKILKKEFGIINVSRNDIIRYKLYRELEGNGFKTLYSDTYIPQEKLFSKEFDIEHIIPRAKLFDDSFSNKTIEVRSINIEKKDDTAYDYVYRKYKEDGVEQYKERIEKLFRSGTISKIKRDKLLMRGTDIHEGFINRDLRDSQYIAKKAREILEGLVGNVLTTTGAVTARLREDWQLVDVLKELNWDKYDKLGRTEIIEDREGRRIRRIKDWTKRNDHRHHAMDALTIAFTKRSFIQYLNNLNAKSDKMGNIYAIEQKELRRNNHGKLKFLSPIMPIEKFRTEAKFHLNNILVSIKAKNKVVTRNVNISKTREGRNRKIQLTPRGQLHNETLYGKIKQYVVREERVNASFNEEKIAFVANRCYRTALEERLKMYSGNPEKAFTGNNSLRKNPLFIDEMRTRMVPETVKVVSFEEVFTMRKEISPDLKIDKVIDIHIRAILKARLEKYGNDPKKAFVNLQDNPIWLNKEKGIIIKRVTIKGKNNVVALHDKHDHFGRTILDLDGKRLPADFVSTSNNHHVAIYCDAAGCLQENVVSFYEATMRANLGMSIIDKDYKKNEGWKFLFTMKQNEYFVFPNKDTGFDPLEVDLLNPENYSMISPNLFRVQKIATKNYFFRHHLETTVETPKELSGITYKSQLGLNGIIGIVKVRINHIGQIIFVGEY